MKVLRTQNLVKLYNKKKVVDHVSIEVHQGEVVGLLGPNGAGKTTTFYMTTGFIAPDAGEVFFEEDGATHDITHMPMYKRARLGIAYLPQEASIFRKLTVEENLMAILELTPLSKVDQEKRKKELLNELKVSHLAKQKAYTLSGGERRRVEIARALVLQPHFILLDEPFVGIDPIAVQDIQGIIRFLKKKQIGILITDHNVRETLSIVDRAYIMFEGKILLSGTAHKLASNKKAKEIYLGERFSLK
ncbi:MAG TPA: LPS export ABC transporter ATP-binding protein [bacterium]|nr:LPS export ABC transporter ATP-binding protein [bacterium]